MKVLPNALQSGRRMDAGRPRPRDDTPSTDVELACKSTLPERFTNDALVLPTLQQYNNTVQMYFNIFSLFRPTLIYILNLIELINK